MGYTAEPLDTWNVSLPKRGNNIQKVKIIVPFILVPFNTAATSLKIAGHHGFPDKSSARGLRTEPEEADAHSAAVHPVWHSGWAWYCIETQPKQTQSPPRVLQTRTIQCVVQTPVRNGHPRSLFYNAVLSVLNKSRKRSALITAERFISVSVCYLSVVWFGVWRALILTVRARSFSACASRRTFSTITVCPDALVVLLTNTWY